MGQPNIISVVPESTLNLIDVLRILKRTMPWVLLAAAAISTLVGIWSFSTVKPYYISTASMISSKQDTPSTAGGLSQVIAQARGSTNELLQYEKILETSNLANRVAEDTKLLNATQIRSGLSVKVDGPTLDVQFRSRDPQTAATIINSYLKNLDAFLQTSFSEKARTNEAFVKARLGEAEASLRQLERGMSSLKVSEANREMQIQTKVVMLLREQYELAQIESKKLQQFYLVIDPPNVPEKPAGPNRILHILLAFVVSVMGLSILSVAIALVRRELHRGPRPVSG